LDETFLNKADLNFKKIESDYGHSSSGKIISDYFVLKKEYKKAVKHVLQTLDLQNSENKNKSQVRSHVFKFYNDFSKELAEMKRLNELKDQKIIDNQLMYIKIGATILLIIVIILVFVEWNARKKRYLTSLKQKSQRSILEAKEQFLENMSHEIRTPITSILGYLSLLKEENLILDKRLNFTNSAIDNTKKMMTSLDNFLNLTSLEGSSEFKNVKTSIKINDFIKEIKSTFSANLEIKKIKLYFKTNAEDSLIINYDIESLTIIVNNLISNAIKYSNSNTSIYFTMYFEKSKLRIMVKDEGFGISDDEKNNIFSRFYQTESNTSNSGFGIGLSLTNNLIKKLNGTIDLETKLNVGSVFKVEVPLIIDNYNLNTTQIDKNFNLICSNTSKELEIDKNNNLPKALVVDDNTEMIIYLKEIFSNFLNCTFAFNGKEALNKINEQSFDIIISDLKMPIMNGIELKNALNKQATSKNIPFIFMTSLIKDKTKDIDLLSFEDYIEKPFKKDEIISRIQFALEKTLNRKKLTSTIDSEIEFDSSSSELIKKVKNCILENLTNPDFTVISLCDLCGYGQKKLNEILKSKIGLSIVNTILEIRLLKAYDLIIKNRYETLKEVVYAVGINSRPYFNKKFELRFGIKPGDLRKKYKNLI
jgi:signal transduction histidine kinase/DNA-binding response OmpR family regulator